jgi:hypothetical protein
MQARAPERDAPHQLHLSLFAPHEISAWEEEQRRKNLRKEQRSTRAPRRFWVREDRATRSLFDAIDVRVLEQPLGGPAEGNELNCETDPLREEGSGHDPHAAPEGDAEQWSDQAVEQLHEAVLQYSLRALQARGNGAEKREILEWIFAPQPMVAVLRDEFGNHTEALLPQSVTPFSFEQCCRICGYSPERLQDGLMPVLQEMGLGNVFNEIANGRNPNETRDFPEALQHP